MEEGRITSYKQSNVHQDGDRQHSVGANWSEAEGWTATNSLSLSKQTDDSESNYFNFALFDDPDPHNTFTFEYNLNADGHKFRTEDYHLTIRLHDYKKENGQPSNTTGHILMSNFLMKNNDLVRDKCVLELETELGLSGILAYFLNTKQIVLTNGDTDSLVQLRKNVDRNLGIPGACTLILPCRQLRWETTSEDFLERWCEREGRDGFDLIMGSDIVKEEELVDPLFDTVSFLLSKTQQDAKFLLSYTKRSVNIDLVLESAERHGFGYEVPTDNEGLFIFQRTR